MPMPAQVQKQSEAVRKLYEELNTDPPSPKPGEGDPQKVLSQDPPANIVDEPEPTPVPEEQGDGDQDDWKQKYQTLQGMFNAEMPRMTAQLEQLSNRNKQLEELISTMQTAEPKKKEEPATPKSLLTDDEKEEYGESIEIMRKVSQEVAGHYEAEIASLKNTISQLQSSVVPQMEKIATNQATTSEQYFWSRLNALVPDWQTTNNDEGFKSWLVEVDPLSGFTRQTFLEDAQNNLDAERVAGFFSAWKKQAGGTGAQPNPAKSELEKQVVPGKGRNNVPNQQGEPKTYTRQDIAKFFDDCVKGKYKGKEKERSEIERDIYAAKAEGRIVDA